jgi:8-oxo-dGTP diphosphatase
VVTGDGNGWVFCSWTGDRELTGGGSPHRHWGRNGAAGLVLLRRRGERHEVLLQLRAAWTHEGGLWGLPGGARDSHETVADAAKREAEEEAAVPEDAVDVLGTWVGTDHTTPATSWTYTYVIARVVGDVDPRVTTPESDDVAWVDLDGVAGADGVAGVTGVADLPLHPYLEATWSELRARIGTALASSGIADRQE